ncbi:MAG: GNAT family N-acetyltransferase [Proteobacteria bacterium]|nr:GNAT family N-acetyltransferase [Pseudomonadota bacterium]
MESRSLHVDEREALLELLDGWELADGWRGRDFFRRYIEIDPSYEDRNVWVAVEDGALVSCVQIFPRQLRLLGHAVPTGGIGSVFTRADKRGAGVAGEVLDRAVEAMKARGMELAILFGRPVGLYKNHGWGSWKCQRTVLRLADPTAVPPRIGDVEIAPFDWERDFEAVRAIHSVYSAPRNGTVVRDAAHWAASFRLSGNPAEEFVVARREGKPVAYARATLLFEVFMVTELGRLEDAAEPLAELILALLSPRDPDPLAPPGKTSRELRSFAVLPAFDDIPLTVAIEGRRVSTHPVDDPANMLLCLSAPALAERLDVSLLPGETGEEILRRLLPEQSLVFWPADRF